MDKVLFIVGPTGVGKSGLAIHLAKKFKGEILSCDAVQVFKGFDIGSAKVKPSEMEGVKHHLIDICEPSEYFSVSDYVKLAKDEISLLNRRGVLPIVVGGTGLYVNALLNGFNFGGTSQHEEFRQKLAQEDNETLWQRLYALAPDMAEKIDKNNQRRLIRGLEIATFGNQQTQEKPDYDYKMFALDLNREKLYLRLNDRVDKMIKEGLVEEVQTLYKLPSTQPMQAIGYKEVAMYLNGEINFEDMKSIIKQHTRNYAKRQLTYLRGLAKTCNMEFVDVEDMDKAKKHIEKEVKEWLNEDK